MTSVRKRTVKGRDYYYLVHAFRLKGEVRTAEVYLGRRVPENLEPATRQLLATEWTEKWIPLFDAIQKRFLEEQRGIPKEVQQQNAEAFAIHFTYDTNRIEGSSLTLQETAAVLSRGLTPASRPLADVLEARLHATLLERILKSTDRSLGQDTLLQWHRDLFSETKPLIAGQLRTYPVAIGGSRFSPPLPREVPGLMRQFYSWYLHSQRSTHPLHLAGAAHLRFESIHPFGDGNGRVGRLLLNFVLNSRHFPLFDLPYNRRMGYYKALETASIEKDETVFLRWFFREYVRQYRRFLLAKD
jgi:Fic family protein